MPWVYLQSLESRTLWSLSVPPRPFLSVVKVASWDSFKESYFSWQQHVCQCQALWAPEVRCHLARPLHAEYCRRTVLLAIKAALGTVSLPLSVCETWPKPHSECTNHSLYLCCSCQEKHSSWSPAGGGVLPPQGASVRRVAREPQHCPAKQDARFDVLPVGWQLQEVTGFPCSS